jgi:hypothetical protein
LSFYSDGLYLQGIPAVSCHKGNNKRNGLKYPVMYCHG